MGFLASLRLNLIFHKLHVFQSLLWIDECIKLMFKIFTFVKTKYLSSEIVHKNVFAVTEYFRYLFIVLHQLFPSF